MTKEKLEQAKVLKSQIDSTSAVIQQLQVQRREMLKNPKDRVSFANTWIDSKVGIRCADLAIAEHEQLLKNLEHSFSLI